MKTKRKKERKHTERKNSYKYTQFAMSLAFVFNVKHVVGKVSHGHCVSMSMSTGAVLLFVYVVAFMLSLWFAPPTSLPCNCCVYLCAHTNTVHDGSAIFFTHLQCLVVLIIFRCTSINNDDHCYSFSYLCFGLNEIFPLSLPLFLFQMDGLRN